MNLFVGADEVGRGAWAGPLVVTAVAAASTWHLTGLNDSKKLSPAARQRLLPLLQPNRRDITRPFSVSTVTLNPQQVDFYGIQVAVQKATELALRYCLQECFLYYHKVEKVYLDGNGTVAPTS